ncbi:hypothetical protein [Streptomyces sp. IB2014 016-6]|uniref:hypothetical protein n=1 Tax=Streptomyces sp. IB2014 016-6 TaxID=2517818 RepID=UPI0011C98420|nr:hypothetical protein [Streptomyces sp. IB2014 016-6]TXL84511.1 hypothetical protein EW053_33935 [Streptomyces sp. IB2014 016-6]
MTDAIVLDGYLDDETVPGLHGAAARFRLTVSPSDEMADEVILLCSVTDPVMAHAVLHDLAPGDHLRVTGHLRLPRTPDEAMWLVVTAVEVLASAPLMGAPATVGTAVMERYGPYTCWHDADSGGDVPVWTETGTWVGVAADPGELSDLIAQFEQRQAVGET